MHHVRGGVRQGTLRAVGSSFKVRGGGMFQGLGWILLLSFATNGFAMGDFERHRIEPVHTLTFTDATTGQLVARVQISAVAHFAEAPLTREELGDRPRPSGPGSRRIVKTISEYLVQAHGQTGQAKLPPAITALVAELKAHQGLPSRERGDGAVPVTPFTDAAFEARLRERIQGTGLQLAALPAER